MKNLIYLALTAFLLTGISADLYSQKSDYEKTKAEIVQTLGTVPQFIDAVPEQMLPMAWELFKSSDNPANQIPAKYVELIKLSVSAQIPCQYCVLAHKVNAKAAGASEKEIKEAVMHGAWVRHWSTLAQSTTMELKAFEKEYMGIVEYMTKKAKK